MPENPLFGLKVIESPHVPKGMVYFVGADTVVVCKGVEIPPPSRWVRFNRWLFAKWWGR